MTDGKEFSEPKQKDVLKVHIYNPFYEGVNIVRYGLDPCDLFNEYVAIEECFNNFISFSDTDNCYINYYNKNNIKSIVNMFDSYLSENFISFENNKKEQKILCISGNIGFTNNLDRYAYINLLSKLIMKFISINFKDDIKINLDIPDFNLEKEYSVLCLESKIPKKYFDCSPPVIAKIEKTYSSQMPIQLEFGSGYDLFPIGGIKKDSRLVFIDPIFQKTQNLYNVYTQIKSKINEFLEFFIKFPTRSKYIQRIITSKTLECMTLKENIEFMNLLSCVYISEFICIVPDMKKIINTKVKKFGCDSHHIVNSNIYGFKNWENGGEYSTIWTEELLESFLKELKKMYKKTYEVDSEYNIVETELNNKKWFNRGEFVIK
ncbi:hypothetical protein M0R19_07515 [Candidatus Pacearchaeota archaeon]|nr:hypothetical protein [bacterium]MCK9597009.1 hypothetical protein [Candidatus Pacearchaeota archaeon]